MNNTKPQPKTLKQRWHRFLRQDAKPLLITALVLFAFRSAIADWNDVPTGSMKPTIIEGDRVFVNKLAYDLKVPFTTWHLAQWDNPARGEIVVFYSPADGKRLVKRVIGLPGDRIELRHDQVLVNDQPLQYQSLPQKYINEIATAEQSSHQYATEDLATHAHPVMSTRNSPAPPRHFGPRDRPRRPILHDGRQPRQQLRLPLLRLRPPQRHRRPRHHRRPPPSDYSSPRWHRFFTTLP